MTPEEYATRHKKAFRVAFDYLNAHFPPGTEDDWCVQMARDGSQAYADGGFDPLQLELLVGVCNYLEKEWRKRQDVAGD